MLATDIISKKRDNNFLTKNEISFFIEQYMLNNIKDYQMSSLLMAIYINGMTFEETNYLTEAFVKSGKVMDLSDIEGIKVDKHSTGGVGDKVSIILAPLLASCGIKIAKLSGRGLGHTGGTIDKLESIKGFNVELSNSDFKKQVDKIGIALGSQTNELTPADKSIYSLRDVTGTVSSIPLIAASIMSKKIACGSDLILLDIKVGKGAFMKNIEDAEKLSEYMINIGKYYNKKIITYITDMNEPLGLAVGNSNEIQESIDVLKGIGPKDITDLVMEMAKDIIMYSKEISVDEAIELINTKINNNDAYNKFLEFIQYQNGDIAYLTNTKLFNVTKNNILIKSNYDGFIKGIDAQGIGNICMLIGAGRKVKTDVIDYNVGINIKKKIGDRVEKGDTLCSIQCNCMLNEDDVIKISNLFLINKLAVKQTKKIFKKTLPNNLQFRF